MGYHPRIESKEKASLLTSRCRNSELWFANNVPLESRILGFAAKYRERYGVKLYALSIEGSHVQAPAHFPNGNRADFMRDFNSQIARAVKLTPNYTGWRLFERRYSNEFLMDGEDIEKYFFYTVLQPVQDGLVEKLSDYPFYNCFHDAVWGIKRKHEVVRWGEYNARKRYNPELTRKDFTDVFTLEYERIPGYESLSQKEYALLMQRKLEERRQQIVAERRAKGLGFAGREALLEVVPGTPAKKPKKSTRYSHRPRVLSSNDKRRAEGREWYFNMYFSYQEASKRYREGDLSVTFPEGMYPPYRPCRHSP